MQYLWNIIDIFYRMWSNNVYPSLFPVNHSEIFDPLLINVGYWKDE